MTTGARRLLLLRHAKSSWSSDALSDCERPLDPRGERAATLMGAYLAQRDVCPSLVLCSAATRARQTWDRVGAQLPERPEVRFLDGLYLATPEEILEQLADVSRATRCILVVGHNPGLEELANDLAGRGADQGTAGGTSKRASKRARKALERLEAGLPTAALVELDIDDASWSELGEGACTLIDLARPKDLV